MDKRQTVFIRRWGNAATDMFLLLTESKRLIEERRSLCRERDAILGDFVRAANEFVEHVDVGVFQLREAEPRPASSQDRRATGGEE